MTTDVLFVTFSVLNLRDYEWLTQQRHRTDNFIMRQCATISNNKLSELIMQGRTTSNSIISTCDHEIGTEGSFVLKNTAVISKRGQTELHYSVQDDVNFHGTVLLQVLFFTEIRTSACVADPPGESMNHIFVAAVHVIDVSWSLA